MSKQKIDADQKSLGSEISFVSLGSEVSMKSVTINGKAHEAFNSQTVFADTATSSNLFKDKKGAYDVEIIQETIKGVGGGTGASWKGKKMKRIDQVDGTHSYLEVFGKGGGTIGDDLFGCHLEGKNGATLSTNDDGHLVLTYPDDHTIIMDRRMQTRDGWVSGVQMTPVDRDDVAQVATIARKARKVSFKQYHEELGHPGMNTTRTTA